MTVIVLVHGAWSGSWSWNGVAPLLRAVGHEVHAPTLTGLAERSHVPPAQVNLSSHICDIAGLMRWNDLRDVILVGHSYGGMVITGAADREIARIRGMIYIDAFVPESGQSLWDMAGPKSAAASPDDVWATRALPARRIAINATETPDLEPRKALAKLPPLLKGYVRIGAKIGAEAVSDRQFGTTDVFIIMPVAEIDPRYISYFSTPETETKLAA